MLNTAMCYLHLYWVIKRFAHHYLSNSRVSIFSSFRWLQASVTNLLVQLIILSTFAEIEDIESRSIAFWRSCFCGLLGLFHSASRSSLASFANSTGGTVEIQEPNQSVAACSWGLRTCLSRRSTCFGCYCSIRLLPRISRSQGIFDCNVFLRQRLL